jgi:hypothetical protein
MKGTERERKINMDSYIGELRMAGFNFGVLSKLSASNDDAALLQFDLSTLRSWITSNQPTSAPLVSFVNYANGSLVNWFGRGGKAIRRDSNRWGSRR